jgi:hypothetical protein
MDGHLIQCQKGKSARVDKLATQAISFAEMKRLLGVEEFLKLRERL